MSIVTIIGAGMMGTAMCWPLIDNGHRVRLVGTPLDEDIIRRILSDGTHPRLDRQVPGGVETYPASQIPEALSGASLVIGGISSFGVDWFAERVLPLLAADTPVLSVTKGLEVQPDGSLLPLPDALAARLPAGLQGKVSFNAIGGPCIAHELAARRQTCVVFTGRNARQLDALRALLATPYYHIRTSTDLVGVEVCAALKNAYAMGISLAAGMMEKAGPDGLANMYNPQAALFGQGCLEMRRLVAALGGNPENVSGLPGAGDLYVTVFGGRTRQLGMLLGKGMTFGEARQALAGVTLECVAIITQVAWALPHLEQRGRLRQADFPLLRHMDAMINTESQVAIPWEEFF